MPTSFPCPRCGATTEVGEKNAAQTVVCAQCGQTITEAADAPAAASTSRKRLVWRDAAILVCVGGGFFTMLVLAVVIPKESAVWATCGNNLKLITFAMYEYSNHYESFPPAYLADEDGRPMHSWRVLLLPYLGQQEVYDQYDFDEPWNGPSNRRLAERVGDIFSCPSSSVESPMTNYVVVAGPGTLFEADRAVGPPNVVVDFATQIVVVEIDASDIHWMEPRDLDVRQMSFAINDPVQPSISSGHGLGVHVGFADGHIDYLKISETDPETLKSMILSQEGKPPP